MGSRAKIAIVATAVALTAVGIASVLTSRYSAYTASTLGMAVGLGWIYVGSGLYGAYRRPQSRVGLLLCLAGLLWLAWLLHESNRSPLDALGTVAYWTATAMIAHLVITFPSGRIRAWTERAIVVSSYANGLFLTLAAWFFIDPHAMGCTVCPRNVLLIRGDPASVDRIGRLGTWLGLATALALIVVMTYRWIVASRAGRRIYGPALWVGVIISVEYFVVVGFFPEWLAPTSRFFWVDQAITAAYPLAFLVGLLRTRMARSAVGDLVIELGRGGRPAGGVRDALAGLLGDPALELVYAVEEAGGWVDGSGHPVELPDAGAGRVATTLELDGEPIAALIHDDAVLADPELVDAVVSAARLAVSNERLQARVRAQLELVRASRDRVVEASDEERRRLERDLHDGAQQRLVWLSLLLGMASDELAAGEGDEGRRLLDDARGEAAAALTELRSLARGIHPAILTNAGLGPAIRALMNRSQIPVRLEAVPERRFAPNVEATAYFVVAEALTNAAKHANGSVATVSLVVRDGRLVVDVRDDGVGGADPAGSGLRGLSDRAAAVGGNVVIASPPQAGTHVHLELPCGS